MIDIKVQQSFFGSSGIRRLWDADLIKTSLKLGLVTGNRYNNVVVGCDTRTSSEALKHAYIAGVLAAGAQACDLGFVPTPTLAFMARDFNAAAMITASHNPPEYNGVKLINPDGSAFDYDQRKQIESDMKDGSFNVCMWNQLLRENCYRAAVESHVEKILDHFPGKYKVNVVVDAGGGAAFMATPYLLNKMGCKVTKLNCMSTGHFPRTIEPNEDSLTELIQTVKRIGADLGIAHDGDADRMMAIDEKGRYIPGDKLLAIFALEYGAKKIATTVDASMIVDEIGLDVIRTKVGDIYISEKLKYDGDWGGEPSGSWVFPKHSFCPDGIYAAAAIIAIASRKKLSSLVDNIPDYPIIRGSIRNNGMNISKLEERLISFFNPIYINKVDGIKLQFEDGWLLIRPSGTEPKMRITVEATSDQKAHELYSRALYLLEKS